VKKGAREQRKAILAVAIALVLMAAVGYRYRSAFFGSPRPPGYVTGDPFPIKFLGLKHEHGSRLFDAAGRPAGSSPLNPFNGLGTTLLGGLVFEIPPDDPLPDFVPVCEIRPPQSKKYVMGDNVTLFHGDAKSYLVCDLRMPENYQRYYLGAQWGGKWLSRTEPVSKADITLRYWRGPRGPARYTFKGPFEFGRVYESLEEEGDATLTCHDYSDWTEWGTKVHLFLKGDLAERDRVLAYDRQGRRYQPLYTFPGAHLEDGTRHVLQRFRRIRPSEIAYVTVGEELRSRTFHDVNLYYPGSPIDPRNSRLATLAGKLGIPKVWELSYKVGGRDAGIVVPIADQLGGAAIEGLEGSFYRYLSTGGAAADDDALKGMRKVIDNWVSSADRFHRASAVRVGLRAGWTDFIEPALEVIGSASELRIQARWYRNVSWMSHLARLKAAEALAENAHLLDETHVERIERLLFSGDCPPSAAPWLAAALYRCAVADATAVLCDMARDPRPLLWFTALPGGKTIDAFGAAGVLPIDIQAKRLILEKFAIQTSQEVRTEAARILPSLVSLDLYDLGHEHYDFEDHLPLVARFCDKETATAAMVDFLRAALSRRDSYYGIYLVVKELNAMHGLDLGDLEASPLLPPWETWVDVSHSITRQRNWHAVAADAINWYETGIHSPLTRAGYRPQEGDFRLVMKAWDDPTLARIYVLPAAYENHCRYYRRDIVFAGYEVRYAYIDPAVDFDALRVDDPLPVGFSHMRRQQTRRPDQRFYVGMYFRDYEYDAVSQGLTTFAAQGEGDSFFSLSDLPVTVLDGTVGESREPDRKPRPVLVVVERADSPESILSGTKVFEDWWEKFGPAE
jgi:hypothetical protein